MALHMLHQRVLVFPAFPTNLALEVDNVDLYVSIVILLIVEALSALLAYVFIRVRVDAHVAVQGVLAQEDLLTDAANVLHVARMALQVLRVVVSILVALSTFAAHIFHDLVVGLHVPLQVHLQFELLFTNFTLKRLDLSMRLPV